MKKSRFSEEKIIEVLKQAEAGVKVGELVRKHGVSASNSARSRRFALVRLSKAPKKVGEVVK